MRGRSLRFLLPLVLLVACEAPETLDTDDSGGSSTTDTGEPDCTPSPELCDNLDNDCDGEIDEDASDASLWYADADADGHGDPDAQASACSAPAGHVASIDDCDDTNDQISPDAVEVCDSVDNDCDGDADSDATDRATWYPDGDADGFGDGSAPVDACDMPAGYIAASGDCDDTDDTVSPSAPELCDGIDNDCNAATPEDGLVTYFQNGGAINDLTASFGSGSSGSPAAITTSISSGDLHVCAGTYYVNLAIDGSSSGIPVRIIGQGGAAAVTLDGGGAAEVIRTNHSAQILEIEGVTIRGGSGTANGGGLRLNAGNTATVRDTVFTANAADRGAAIGGPPDTLLLERVTIDGNTATDQGGGIRMSGSSVTIVDSTITNNTATLGGGIYLSSGASVTLTNTEVSANTPTDLHRTADGPGTIGGVANGSCTDGASCSF